MHTTSLFNSLCHFPKRLSLLALLILSVAATLHAAELNALSITGMEGDCGALLELFIEGEFRGTNDDDDNRDEITFLLYDGTGRIILYEPMSMDEGDVENNFDFSIVDDPEARPFTLKVYDTDFGTSDPVEAATYPLLGLISFDPADFGHCTDLPFVETSSMGNPNAVPQFYDGRLNNYDMATPVVPYGHDYENGRGLVVYSPEGALLLEVRPEAIAAVAECPEQNTLIAASGNVALYRLPNCDFQLNAPSLDGTKTYVMIFDSLYQTGYSSHEE